MKFKLLSISIILSFAFSVSLPSMKMLMLFDDFDSMDDFGPTMDTLEFSENEFLVQNSQEILDQFFKLPPSLQDAFLKACKDEQRLSDIQAKEINTYTSDLLRLTTHPFRRITAEAQLVCDAAFTWDAKTHVWKFAPLFSFSKNQLTGHDVSENPEVH